MRAWTLLLAACAPASRWAETHALCDAPSAPLDAASMAAPPAYPSEACVDAVLADFGADRDALLAADGLDHPYGLVYGDPIGETATGELLWAAHALLAADLGRFDPHDPRLNTTFREALRRTGGSDQLAPLLYDYVTARIRRTAAGTDPDASAGLQGGRLWVYDLPKGIDGAAVLVHEARHRDGPDHVWCGGSPSCDRDDSGSVGFEIAVHQLVERAADDETVLALQQQWIDVLGERILD